MQNYLLHRNRLMVDHQQLFLPLPNATHHSWTQQDIGPWLTRVIRETLSQKLQVELNSNKLGICVVYFKNAISALHFNNKYYRAFDLSGELQGTLEMLLN